MKKTEDPNYKEINRILAEGGSGTGWFLMDVAEFCACPVKDRPYIVGEFSYFVGGKLYVRCTYDRPDKLDFEPRRMVWDRYGWGYLGGGGTYRGWNPAEFRRLYYPHRRGYRCACMKGGVKPPEHEFQLGVCCDVMMYDADDDSRGAYCCENAMGCRYCQHNPESLPPT